MKKNCVDVPLDRWPPEINGVLSKNFKYLTSSLVGYNVIYCIYFHDNNNKNLMDGIFTNYYY